MLDEESIRYKILDHISWVINNEEVILLDNKRGIFFGLDEVASRIWILISEGKMVREIIDTLMEEYDVEISRLESDVKNLIDELILNNFIKSDGFKN
ncbi:Coenzyme PQQ synthesis protein D (PqqD) [Caldanaerobius fijiensis DSM 17918]|uniref:Coenzyme PQQ synthesis protein D (PqqD) n=1 Tax=Caldanaerobius fijiensis DSM 17918 TaxID=1121256 RepID=A0A1M4Y1Q2_9THEO|nr:PqqD family protein [Caldanaerobius fijiensis]SHE99503.1 Coenzyme PQQ synthesis protein D (PqqD) [Caldanaerobius fijiensis DSM 17918]